MSVVISPKMLLYRRKLDDTRAVEIENGKIKAVPLKKDVSNIDYTYDGILIPGLIDTHIHGYKGVEVIEGSVEEIVDMRMNLLECGVTSFFPTLQTDSLDRYKKAIRAIVKASYFKEGARIAGIFLEGPFLSKKFKGAQDERFLKLPSKELLAKWQKESKNMIKKIAVAPELKGALDFIQYATDQGVTVAIGHSNATAEETEKASKYGAKIIVHTFNAMRALHHREPGILGEGLINDNLFAEINSDGVHLNPKIIQLILKIKGIDRSILITDGTKASGLPDGIYKRGDKEVVVEDGAVRTKDGLLAGSSSTMIKAVKNIVKWEQLPFEQVIQMASENPAKSIKMNNYIGKISEGTHADFVVLDDKLNVVSTWVDGREQYRIK